MEEDNRFLQHLEKNPGLTARDIADDLDLDKSECLRDLRELEQRAKIYEDVSYRWWIGRKSENEEQRAPVQAPDDEKVQRLAQYYLDCITHDIQDGISCFADSKYDLDYAELPMFPRSTGEWRQAFQTTDVHALLSRGVHRNREKRLPLVGYPVLLKHIVSKKGWEGYIVVPVLYQRIDNNSIHADTIGQSFNEVPILNPQVLQDLSGLHRSDLITELMHLSEELGLNADAYYGEVDEIVERLKLLRPTWPWREDMRPEATSEGLAIRELQEEGIYNRCTIMLVKRPRYTVGLERELLQLSKKNKSLWHGTALDDWVNAKAAPVERRRSQPLLEIVPLNAEQRAAVEQGLSRPLTVVTGPPGTGKSQVVMSLLLNAAWQGQTALFASKNNKAIDVVEARVNALGSRPSLLRLGGRRDIQPALSEHLLFLLSASAVDEDRSAFERAKRSHEEIRQRFEQVTAKLEAIVKLRNSVDHHERLVEPLRTRLGYTQFLAYKSFDKDKIGGELQTMAKQLRRADKEAQPITVRLAWFLVKKRRYKELGKYCENLTSTLETLRQIPPAKPPGDESMDKWRSFVEDVHHSFDDASAIQEYFALLDTLQSMGSIEDCYREYALLVEQMSAVSHTLWKLWLRIQPDRLSKEERGKLQEYSTIIQMRVSADESGRSLRASSFRRLHELFPKVIGSLPCWAVTSLSARGRLPLEPGLFDLLIIDEASQCDIASALPLLFRAKRVIIIGDPMQLRHITRLRKQKDQQLLAKYDLIDTHLGWAYSVNSLFDVASGLCDKEDIISLRDHHRSHADIISFSNEEFYEGRLRIATKYDKLRVPQGKEPVVRWVDVQGEVRRLSGGIVNHEEAQKVVEVLEKLVLEQGYLGSIGVVSPFHGQADRVLDLIKQRPELHRRLDLQEFESSTVHRFQGDERDLMVFSPVISHGVDERGFLERNPNLFNVAITRARSALVVVGDRQTALESGVKYLERFARYVKRLEHKTEPRIQEATEIGEDYTPLDGGQWVSEWERILQRALTEAGVEVLPQYPVDKYVLDLAVVIGNRKLDIEVDGERYHRDWDGELLRRDRLRNMRVFEVGWDVMRFWVYEVRDELERCTERVLAWVQKAEVDQ